MACFSDFLQQYFQLKFGKQHARAYQMGMKQMSKVAAEVEHYYDKSSRVRIFARAAGILVCCEGGICSCKCPNLLNVSSSSGGGGNGGGFEALSLLLVVVVYVVVFLLTPSFALSRLTLSGTH